ncbi:MAG: phosphatidylglycerophosphatase A [Gammaproteobacteria bacterium]|nr:phosphatidylglycerophosphatase A [Gammaproteobacteria bacterium]
MNPNLAKYVLRNPIHFLAFGFGAGLSPVAPGTMGTIVGIPVYLLLVQFSQHVYITVVFLFAVLGVWLCHTSAKALNVPDHPGIVWDEITGFLITMFLLPVGWKEILAGFLLFRLFDIWKPFPIRWLDRQIKGGLGIMLDDIVAGLFAFFILQAMMKLWGSVLPGF